MKHIKLFNTDTQYQEFASDIEQPIPNVSYVTETDEVHYNESDPILFAYEYQADKFVMGVVIGSDIYVDTYETGFIVADGSGKFSTALAYTNDDLINIQNAIKDHYHLAASTIKTKAPLIEYAVGDTIPNWTAYEKIEMTKSQKIAIGFNRNIAFSFGEIRNDIFFIIVNSESQGIWAKDDGEVVSYSGPNDEAKSYLIETLSNKGINISDVINEISNLQIGEIVGDWSEYEKILQ